VQDLPELERAPAGAASRFIGSSTGALLVEDDRAAADFKVIRRRAAFHAEDEYRLNDRKGLRIEGESALPSGVRDEAAALMATRRLVKLAHETGKAHSCAAYFRPGRRSNFCAIHKDVASCEATPHHLNWSLGLLRAARYRAHESPVRSADHRDGIWRGIEQGIIDVLGSDHAPHTLERRPRPIRPRHRA